MNRVAKHIADKAVLRLIRRYLEAGIMANGVVTEHTEGTSQGSPLSPLLANVVRRLFGYGGTVASLLP